jgi:putative tryptophan/tyrosine transport system substrate-binding protein
MAATCEWTRSHDGGGTVDDGGLIAYGPNVPDNYRRDAGYIDRILKGAKPGGLPFQRPAKFDFIVNLKATRTLGVILPPDLLARADEVIE